MLWEELYSQSSKSAICSEKYETPWKRVRKAPPLGYRIWWLFVPNLNWTLRSVLAFGQISSFHSKKVGWTSSFRRLICYFLIRLANIVQMHSVSHHSSCRNGSLRTRIPNQYRFAMLADICHAIELVSDAKLLWNAQHEIFILAHSTMPCFSHYDPIMMYSCFWEQAEVLFCIMLLVT